MPPDLQGLIEDCINNKFRNGSWELLAKSLNTSTDPCSPLLMGKLLLHAVCNTDNVGIIKTILGRNPSLTNTLPPENKNALQLAGSLGRKNIEITLKDYMIRRSKTNFGKGRMVFSQVSKSSYFWSTGKFTDLRKYPQKIPPSELKGYDTLTLGDMHGNALKLVHILTMFSFWNLNMSDYIILKNCYSNMNSSQPTFRKRQITTFAGIIENLNPIRNSIKKLRFLGDMFADRGKNDYLTLLVLQWLKKNRIKYEIMLSNHGIELLFAYLNGDFKNHKPWTGPATSFKGLQSCIKDSLCSQQNFLPQHEVNLSPRLTNLNHVERGFLSEQQIRSMVEKYFIPHLKLFSVEIPYSQNPNGRLRLIFYTHAPVSFNVIEKIMIKFANSKAHPGLGIIKDAAKKANKNFLKWACDQNYRQIALGKYFEVARKKPKSSICSCLLQWCHKNSTRNIDDTQSNPNYPVFSLAWARTISPHNLKSNFLASQHYKRHITFVHGHMGDSTIPQSNESKVCSIYDNFDTGLGWTDPKTEEVIQAGPFKYSLSYDGYEPLCRNPEPTTSQKKILHNE